MRFRNFRNSQGIYSSFTFGSLEKYFNLKHYFSMAVIIKQDLETVPKGPFDGRLDPLSLLLLTGLDDIFPIIFMYLIAQFSK